jgi:CHAD domain-containing protein
MAQSRIRAQAQGEARQFAAHQAQRQLRYLVLQINRAIKSCNTDAVHDVRVAIRRFTQAIAVCHTCFRAMDMPKNRRRLKKIMAGAGEVRDLDVAMKFITRFRVPHAVHLRSKLQSLREESAGHLVAELRKWTERRMSFKWRAALKSAPTPDEGTQSEEAIQELAQRALGRIAKDFLKQGNEASSPDASPKGLHHFRIVAKKFRYALELFQPLYGSSLNAVVARIKHASALLGDLNDCVTVAGIVAQYKGGNRLVDRLKKRQHKKAEEFRKYWTEEFSDGVRLRHSIDRLNKKPVASSRTISAHPRKSAA